MSLQTYRDLIVWQFAMDMVEAIYRLCRELPDGERFGLITQIQRAAVSVPANIAEGYGRSGRKEYLRFLTIARGSLMEVETHLALIGRLYPQHRDTAAAIWPVCQDTGRLLHKLIASLQCHPEP